MKSDYALCSLGDATAGRRDWRPSLLAGVVGVAVYAVTLWGGFVYDDVTIILRDGRMSAPAEWRRFWTEAYNPAASDNLYRPLVSTSYAVQRWVDGEKAWPFHLVNVLMHGAVCAAVAEMARRLAGGGDNGRAVGCVAGLLFAAHPVHVEAVANIVGRAELGCALGVVGGACLALRPMNVRRAAAIAACFWLAVLCKEQGVVLAAVVILVLFCRRWAGPIEAAERRGMTWAAVLLMWSVVGYVVFRETGPRGLRLSWDRASLDWTANPLVRSTGVSRWLMPVELLGRYAGLLVWPARLSPDYGGSVIGWEVRWGDAYLYAGMTAVAAWVAAAVWAVRRRWAAGVVCLGGLAAAYGIVSNFGMLIGTNFGERLMYLPSVFFLVLVAMGIGRLRGRVLVVLMVIVMGLACAKTVTAAHRWNDPLAFYEASLREQPGSIRLYILLGEELLRQGKPDRAAAVMAEARRVEPSYGPAWLLAGRVEMERGNWSAAGQFLDEAQRLMPNPMAVMSAREELEERENRNSRR